MPVLNPSEAMFTAFEPVLSHRFVMYMDGFPAYLVRKVVAPGYTDSVVKLDHINTYRKVRGKREWKDMSFELYNPVTPSAAQATMEWARLAYESVTGRAGYSDFYKKDLTFNILGPVDDIVGEWIIKCAFINDVTFGDFDYGSDAYTTINMTIAMDYCVLNY